MFIYLSWGTQAQARFLNSGPHESPRIISINRLNANLSLFVRWDIGTDGHSAHRNRCPRNIISCSRPNHDKQRCFGSCFFLSWFWLFSFAILLCENLFYSICSGGSLKLTKFKKWLVKVYALSVQLWTLWCVKATLFGEGDLLVAPQKTTESVSSC